jgi:hypothetical protein
MSEKLPRKLTRKSEDAELYTIWKGNTWPNFSNVRNNFWKY